MIKKITMDAVASYTKPTSLETDKKINLIYGLNGSGKTVISNYLRNINDPEFKRCKIEDFNPEQQKILVYNQAFIEEIFYEATTQKGIFTLSKENKQAAENIKKAEEKRKQLHEQREKCQTGPISISNTEKAISDNYDGAKNTIWQIKETYTGGDRVFDRAGFLNGLKNSKEKLFDFLNGIEFVDITKTISEIKKELTDIGDNPVKREEILLLEPIQSKVIENNPIFKEEIIGSKNSSVSALIEGLGNSDWVKQGLEYLDEKGNNCPFCQQETVTPELAKEIRDYFDDAYDRKIGELEKLEQSYRALNSIDLAHYRRDFFEESRTSEFEVLFNELDRILENNLNTISTKIKSASQSVVLKSSKDVIDQINDFIAKQNEEIRSFNTNIDNREQIIKQLKTEFWKIQRNKYNFVISNYTERDNQLKNEKQQIEKEQKTLEQAITEQNEIISENQKNTININEKIEAINKHLLDFGIKDCQIVEHDEKNYRIQREYEQDKPVFKSLSEGEKTVISFLYFVELCKGKEDRDDAKEKIVVIDDPISSLSHMYIFNVAQLINRSFIGPPKNDFLQCFILTHSLYFFHEFVRGKLKSKKFFRITKHETSVIAKMDHSEIQNDYEVYWDIVKNASEADMTLVANAMRNIIEHFFGFIKRIESINDIFKKSDFQDNKFKSFHRYINRESHSDKMNISDYREFDLNIFREAFEKMFKEAGYEEHYKTYMEDKT